MAKQIQLGRAVAAKAAKNPAWGRAIDKKAHHSSGRLRMAKSKARKKKRG